MNKIYLQLSGGLGNQLFQYAVGRILQEDNSKVLNYEIFSGFINDEYKRKNMLQGLVKKKQEASLFVSFVFILFRIIKFFYKRRIINFFSIVFIDNSLQEFNFKLLKLNIKKNKNIFIIGQIQDPSIFKAKSNIIYKEITDFLSAKSNLKKIPSKISNKSIAVCIRNFEEVKDSDLKFVGGKCSEKFYLKCVKNFNSIKSKKIFLFTQNFKSINKKIFKKYQFFKNLNEFETILILSNFKNIIISNSSFFWWGAWLSSIRYKNKNKILTNNHFPKKYTNMKLWKIIIDN
tara:strand:+ start:721 stop:1587 length:867 start_codon:yes stop_codon:yes gene_type:complete